MEQFAKPIARMLDLPLGVYRHYKGNHYRVLGIAHHSETLEPLVVYQALYEIPEFGKDALWVRPASMFVEMVEVNGKSVPRFTYVGSHDHIKAQ